MASTSNIQPDQIYLVGGAVRDKLLGRTVRERDWVVVGSNPKQMIDAGFRQVGRDFPVFLHPETGEEYALARTERKTGAGHTGFECYAAEDVTLEQDLARRDLTINAIAEDARGSLIDPFDGRADLAIGVLRHVSPAFVEDPLRIFRVARFAALLPRFQVADETIALMTAMARDGALDELSAERVWVEWHKALGADAPQRFLAVLDSADAMAPWFSGIDAGATSRLFCGAAFTTGAVSPEVRNAALGWLHPPPVVSALMARLKAPKRFRRPAELVALHKATLTAWRECDAAELLAAIVSIGSFRDSRASAPVLDVLELCSGQSLADLRKLIEGLRDVRPDTDATGAAFGAELREARLAYLRRGMTSD